MKTGKYAWKKNQNCIETTGVVGDEVIVTGTVYRLTEEVEAGFWKSEMAKISPDPAGQTSYIGSDGEIHWRKTRKPAARTPASKVMGGGYYD